MSATVPTESELFPDGLQGLRYFGALRKLLEPLHLHRDHPNRELHYDELALWLLLSYFNPALDSMRMLQTASTCEGVQQRTGLRRFSLGAFSEAARLFDPDLLHAIFSDLAQRLPPATRQAPASVPPELRVLLADGSIWKALPRMARAFYAGPLTR